VGELDSKTIDLLIQAIDFGVATTPLDGIGKSGSAMAFLERGKPLIGCFQKSKLIGMEANLFPSGQIVPIDKITSSMLASSPTFPRRDLLPQVARRYLEILKNR